METTGIRELKAHLSRYLRRVQAGETIVVTDRGRVIAEVHPPAAAGGVTTPREVRYQQLVASGLVRPAVAPRDRSWTAWSGFGLPRGYAQSILEAERE